MDTALRDIDQLLTLPDGRTIGYATYGDPTGYPVLYMHGGLSCRIDATSCGPAAAAAGIRVIAPDRPGIGLSDRHKGASLLDWPVDMGHLIHALGIEQCAAMGWSFGSAYAAACGFALPQVTDTVLIASPIPCDWHGMREQINEMDRRFMKLSRHAGFIDESAFLAMREMALHRPNAFVSQATADLSDHSKSMIAINPQEFIDASLGAFVHPSGALDDYRIWDQPWGFDLASLGTPTQIWHGTVDELCPPEWAGRLRDAISDSELHLVADAGHFLAHDHWDQIFARIAV